MPFTPSASRTIKVKASSRTFEAPANSTFYDMADPSRPIGIKDPDSGIDICFDWGEVLADIQDTIAAVTYVMGGVTNGGTYALGALTAIVAAGGVEDAVTSVTSRITTASTPPRTFDATVFLKIQTR